MWAEEDLPAELRPPAAQASSHSRNACRCGLELLAYHRMGEVKSAQLGLPLPPLGLLHPSGARASLERAAVSTSSSF